MLFITSSLGAGSAGHAQWVNELIRKSPWIGVMMGPAECVDAPVREYFITGEMPDEYTLCEALPLPLDTEAHQVAGTPTHKGDIKITMRTEAVKEANRITEDAMQRELLDSRAVVPSIYDFLNR